MEIKYINDLIARWNRANYPRIDAPTDAGWYWFDGKQWIGPYSNRKQCMEMAS